MIYGVINTSQQIVVESINYIPTENEILMKCERPSVKHIARTDGVWCLPKINLSELKEQKILLFKSCRDREEAAVIEYNNKIFDYDDKARERMRIAEKALTDNNLASQLWTCADNTQVELTVQDFKNINSLAAQRSGALHVKYNELKDAVNALVEDTPENKIALEAITW